MSTFDVRDFKDEPITNIRFSSDIFNDTILASTLVRRDDLSIEIRDEQYSEEGDGIGQLVVYGKKHAQDLIKALNKAIEIGWLK